LTPWTVFRRASSLAAVLYAGEGSRAEVLDALVCRRDPSLRLKNGCTQDDAERNGPKLHHYPLRPAFILFLHLVSELLFRSDKELLVFSLARRASFFPVNLAPNKPRRSGVWE
jgi:hypothetical protein